MKHIFLSAVLAAGMLASPASLLPTLASTHVAALCQGDAIPEALARPGGFCDQVNSLDSLIEPSDSAPAIKVHDCAAVVNGHAPVGSRVLVADRGPCDPCLLGAVQVQHLPVGGRVLVAADCPPLP